MNEIFNVVKRILAVVAKNGGKAYLVGGCVRDAILNSKNGSPLDFGVNKDFDIEVFGITLDNLTKAVGDAYDVDLVGKSFGVLKVKGLPIDIGLPRIERKTGDGHKDFEVAPAPWIDLPTAALRRDFTINAIYYDFESSEVIDPYNGVNDLNSKILINVSDQFDEDPLRVLRAMQFIARFDLNPTGGLVSRCEKLLQSHLPKERVQEEWEKMILRGVKIGKGLQFLRDCHWLYNYPELFYLKGIVQDSDHHPEGDVWEHTKHCMDSFAAARKPEYLDVDNLVVGYSVLLHDTGKRDSTTIDDQGKIHAYGHEDLSGPLSRSFLTRIYSENQKFLTDVEALVRAHMRPVSLFKDKAGKSAIRRLAQAVGRLDLLMRVVDADQGGRPPKVPTHHEAKQWLLAKAEELNVTDSRVKPILMGRHLIQQFNMVPSRQFGDILSEAFEAQLDGIFDDEKTGLIWLSGRLGKTKLEVV